MLDVHNDTVPSSIMKLFTRTSNIHTYTTRSSTSQLFSVKYSKKKKAFSGVGVKVWNEMPNECKNLSKKSFFVLSCYISSFPFYSSEVKLSQ